MAFEDIKEKMQAVRNIVGADALVIENSKLKQKIREQNQVQIIDRTSYEKSLHVKDQEISQLKVELEKSNLLTITYNKSRYSPKAFEAEVNKKIDDKVEQRIQLEAGRRYLAKKDKLVQMEIARYPNCTPETWQTIDAKVTENVDNILFDSSKWPPRFNIYFNNEVRVEAEKLKNQSYYAAVEQGANQRLENLKNGSWRLYIERFCRDRLDPFLRDHFITQVISITEIFNVACPKCRNTITFRLTPDTLAATSRGIPATIRCQYCNDWWGRQTAFKLTLGDILWYLLYGVESTLSAPRIAIGHFISVESQDEEKNE